MVDGGWFGSAGESYRMITERSDHTATLLLDGRVLVTGGMDTNGNDPDSAELYTINELDAFSATGSMSDVRRGHRQPPMEKSWWSAVGELMLYLFPLQSCMILSQGGFPPQRQ
jgi:hypothetical protein